MCLLPLVTLIYCLHSPFFILLYSRISFKFISICSFFILFHLMWVHLHFSCIKAINNISLWLYKIVPRAIWYILNFNVIATAVKIGESSKVLCVPTPTHNLLNLITLGEQWAQFIIICFYYFKQTMMMICPTMYILSISHIERECVSQYKFSLFEWKT